MNNLPKLFLNSNHLGAFNPFYYIDDTGKFVFKQSLIEIMTDYPGEVEIDVGSVMCVLSKNFMFGDKTIIKGVHRVPWMATLNENETKWTYHTLPKHDEKI